MQRRADFLVLVLLALAVSGCSDRTPVGGKRSDGASGSPWFEDFAARAGIEFVHQAEFSGRYLFPESIGSGVAWLDFDNDGRLDAFFIHNKANATNRLFHQEADGSFHDVSAGSGLEAAGLGQGLAVGDANNDGRPEILITEYDRIRLFENLGGGRFADVTAAAGLTNAYWSVPAAWVDYDRDGWLDLVVGNYLDFDPTLKCPDALGQPDFCGPHGFRSTLTRLFRNRGAPGPPRFEDVTVKSGLARAPGKAMQILCADFNGDHWPDIFITDDGLPNRLFVNQRDGTFTEEALMRGLAYTGVGAPAANMGIAHGDVDGDGLFDVFVPHLAEENHTLWRQGPRGLFQDGTARAGLASLPWHGTGFAAALADLDCDGADDLVIVNGRVRRSLKTSDALRCGFGLGSTHLARYAEPVQLFANDGSGRFRDISAANLLCSTITALVGRGMACGDLDNDGGLDLVIIGIGEAARVYRNVARRGHWIGIRAVDPALGGRDAYGAEVEVVAGGRRWWRLVQPAWSYASSNDPRVLFGLGSATAVDFIQVRWPDGTAETFPSERVDRYVMLQKGRGQVTGLKP